MDPKISAKLGLGCSRLGSALSGNKQQAFALLSAAYNIGIRSFDTADIYGQGDSERILGEFFKDKSDIFLITKVGQVFPWYWRLLMPFKTSVRKLANLSAAAKSQVRERRAKSLPRDFSDLHIKTSLDRSLRRLRRQSVNVLLLHSPAVDVIRRGHAIETLATLKRSGKVELIGASCDDLETAFAVVKDPRTDVIQIPLSIWSREFLPIAAAARDRGMIVIAREILGGVRAPNAPPKTLEDLRAAIDAIGSNSNVDLLLIGTTNPNHLAMLLGEA